VVVVLAGVLSAGSLARAGDWERFRGPAGSGIAADAQVPVSWQDGNGILWKAAIPGIGHSSPIVSRGRIFLQSASADGTQRWLICLDAATGKQLWKKDAPGSRAQTHPRNTLASSTPAADGKRVYAVYWDGEDILLSAYDYKGNAQWKCELGGFRSQHGAGLSPIVDDGHVFINNDQDGSAHLLAFDATSSRILWRVERKAFRACYSTPFIRQHAGHKELVVASTAGITGYDPATGKQKWDYTWSFERRPLRTVASPILTGDIVVASSGDGAGDRHTIAVRLAPQGDEIHPTLLWEKTRDVPYVPCFLAHEGHLYGVTDQGLAICLDAATGETGWNERLRGQFTASPVLIQDRVYAPAEDGKVYVFAAATTFKLLAANRLGEPVMASPAVADNRLFIRGKQHLFCIGKPAASRAAAR
jgi:outer membrane protein assembly factor BamB